MKLLAVNLVICKIKISFIVVKPISSVSVKYLVIKNECLQYCLNAFDHDVDDLEKATILCSVVHWDQYAIYRTNDNAFIFNWILGNNTSLYDDIDNKW